jgi:hypothetical protein
MCSGRIARRHSSVNTVRCIERIRSRDPQSKTLDFPVLPLAEAVATAGVVINATLGSGSLETLTSIDAVADRIVLTWEHFPSSERLS